MHNSILHTFFLYAFFGPLFGYSLLLIFGRFFLKENSFYWSEILTVPLAIPVVALLLFWGKPCPLLTLTNSSFKSFGSFLCFVGDIVSNYFAPVFLFAALYGVGELIKPYLTFSRFLKKTGLLKQDEQLEAIIAELTAKMGVIGVRSYVAPGKMTAFTFNFLKPKVVIGEEYAKSLTKDELKAVFAHELAHIKARDSLVISLCQFATYLYFFVPGLKKYFQEILYYRELSADKVALGYLGEKENLAQALVKTCKFEASKAWISFAGDNDVELRRMQAIIESDLKIPTRNLYYYIFLGFIVTLSLFFLYYIC